MDDKNHSMSAHLFYFMEKMMHDIPCPGRTPSEGNLSDKSLDEVAPPEQGSC